MANLTAIIGADTSKFVEEVKSAKYMLNKFVKDTEQASNTARENASASKEQIQAYSRVISQLEKVASGTLNTKQQQQALADQIKELKVQWQSLSDSAKSSDFGKSLSDTLKNATTELDNLKNKLATVDDVKPKGTLKRQLRDTTQELTNLTDKYRAMSAAEKASASGMELAAKMDELREKAGGLADTIGDVQQEIQVMASDTPNLDVFNDALGIGADLLSTYSSVLAKVTGDEESLKSAISTVMAVQSAANLMTKVTNALQSSSAIMLKTRAIQEGAAAVAIKIRTAAEGKGTVATKAATAAQAAFNLVAKANPYVLLATAILGVGAALVAFSRKSDEATAAEKKAQEAAEQAKQSWDDFKNTASNAGATLLTTYTKLQTEWKNLKSEHEKVQWIKDNQQAFNNLGVEIDNVGDAENFLVANTDKVVQAFMLRAKAAAYAAKAQEMWGKYIDKEMEYNKRKVSAGDEVPRYARPSGVTRDNNGHGTTANGGRYNVNNALTITSFTKKGADEYNQKLRGEIGLTNEAQSEIRSFTENQVELEKEAQAILKSGGVRTHKSGGGGRTSGRSGKSGRTSSNSNAPTFAKGSLSDLENQLSTLQSKYKDGLLPKLTTDKYLEQVDKLETQIKQKKMELGLIPVLPEGSVAKIDEEISKKQRELNLAVDDASRKKIQDEIDVLTGKKEAIQLYLKPVVEKDDIDDITKTISEHLEGKTTVPLNVGATKSEKAQSNADNLKEELDFQKSIISSYAKEYSLIQQRIAAGATLTDNESKLVSIYDEAIGKVQELSDEYKNASANARELQLSAQLKKKTWEGVKSGIGTLGDLNGAVGNVGSTWKGLAEQWEDMSSFEQVTSAIDATISTIETCIGAYEAINDIIKLFGEISEISAAKKMAANSTEMASDQAKMAMETANTQTKLANDTAENTSEIGKLGVKEAGAIAGATSSGASLPFPANIAAIAAGIAAVVAAFAMVFSCFADGGIVGNGSKIGDYNIARVNGGEMILNGTQQKRLFNLLDGTDSRNGSVVGEGGNVQFKIKGNNLYGVLRNHTQKGNKIGR